MMDEGQQEMLLSIARMEERQRYSDQRADRMEELLNKTVETVNKLSITVEKYVDNQNRSEKEIGDTKEKVEKAENKGKIDVVTLLVSIVTACIIGYVTSKIS